MSGDGSAEREDDDWSPDPTSLDDAERRSDGSEHGAGGSARFAGGSTASTGGHGDAREETAYCTNCGSEVAARAELCPECGVRRRDPPSAGGGDEKEPGVAAILSFFIPGAGQLYNGQASKGLVLFVAWFASVLGFAFLFPLLVTVVVWLFATVDAYSSARKINSGEITVD